MRLPQVPMTDTWQLAEETRFCMCGIYVPMSTSRYGSSAMVVERVMPSCSSVVPPVLRWLGRPCAAPPSPLLRAPRPVPLGVDVTLDWFLFSVGVRVSTVPWYRYSNYGYVLHLSHHECGQVTCLLLSSVICALTGRCWVIHSRNLSESCSWCPPRAHATQPKLPKTALVHARVYELPI